MCDPFVHARANGMKTINLGWPYTVQTQSSRAQVYEFEQLLQILVLNSQLHLSNQVLLHKRS